MPVSTTGSGGRAGGLGRAAGTSTPSRQDSAAGAKRSAPDSASAPSEATPAALFPLRLLGMGLVVAWDWCLSIQLPALPGMSDVPGMQTFNVVLVCAEVAALLALALASRRVGPLSGRPGLFWAAAALGAAAPLAACCCGALAGRAAVPGGLLAGILYLGGASAGFSMAVLILAWAEAYGRMEPGRVLAFGALGLLAGVGAYGLVADLTPGLRLAACSVVPALSYIGCWLSFAYVGREEPAGRSGMRCSLPWKPVLIMAVCGFGAAFIDIALFQQGAVPHIMADALLGIGLAAALLASRGRLKPVALVGVALACMAAGVAAVAALGAGAAFLASTLTMLGYVSITFFTYALLANMCYRRDIPSMWLFGFAVAARVVADHLGGFARMAFPQLGAVAGQRLGLALVAVAGMAMIGVVAAVWMSERSFSSDWAVSGVDARLGRHVPTRHELLVVGCERLAAERGLTEREAEVLTMLAEGRSYQELCSSLFLSQNTVKTHARHAYGKLGVHTREEAMELALAAARER